jgi:hypothetical protein
MLSIKEKSSQTQGIMTYFPLESNHTIAFYRVFFNIFYVYNILELLNSVLSFKNI